MTEFAALVVLAPFALMAWLVFFFGGLWSDLCNWLADTIIRLAGDEIDARHSKDARGYYSHPEGPWE